jgi:vacuolar-type H+-ATPase subunit E/Vma4
MDTRRNGDGALALFRHSLENVKGRDDILSFVEHLIFERDELAKRQEHLNSLARLMEKTVADADDVAAQIKKQAEEDAHGRAKNVVAEAEEQARQITEEAKAKALSQVQAEILAMKSDATRELEAILKEQAARMQAQAKEMSERMYLEMMSQAEECNRRLTLFQEELEKSLASVQNLTGAVAVEVGAGAASAVGVLPAKEPVAQPPAAAAPAAAPPRKGADRELDRQEVHEIEILPPRDKKTIEGIRDYLSRQDEVGLAEIEHLTDKTLIQVRLLRPLDLVSRLSRLSEIEQVQEVTEGNRKKIEILLSVNSEIERERDALNSRANRIASRISRLAK